MGSKRNRNKHNHVHRQLSDEEARSIASSMQAEDGKCYVCFHSFVPGDQVTSMVLPGKGPVDLCTPCIHDLKDSLSSAGVTIPSMGEPLRSQRHEVTYNGKDFIFRG